MDLEKTAKWIGQEEGFRNEAYKDHLGKWTIGIGHLLEGKGYSEEQMASMYWTDAEVTHNFEKDIQAVLRGLDRNIPWWADLSEVRQAVLISMGFQMGVEGLLAFKRTLAAIKDGRYSDAASYMLESKWAKQTPNRAKRTAKMMETDLWPWEF